MFGTSGYIREIANNSRPTDDYFDSLKIIVSAGTSLKAEMVEEFRKRWFQYFLLLQGYSHLLYTNIANYFLIIIYSQSFLHFHFAVFRR